MGDHLVRRHGYRVYTIGAQSGAVQIARVLDEVDAVLDDVRQRTLILVFLVSVAAAAWAG